MNSTGHLVYVLPTSPLRPNRAYLDLVLGNDYFAETLHYLFLRN